MTKNELIGLLNINMIHSLRMRDKTDPLSYSEEFGFYNGQYRTYESLISLLTTVDIEYIRSSDSRSFERV